MSELTTKYIKDKKEKKSFEEVQKEIELKKKRGIDKLQIKLQKYLMQKCISEKQKCKEEKKYYDIIKNLEESMSDDELCLIQNKITDKLNCIVRNYKSLITKNYNQH